MHVAVIWETTGRLGRRVVLTDAGWAHVLDQRIEFAGLEEEVRQAVESADEIRHDAKYAHRDLHYRETGPGLRRLRVVVHYRPSEAFGWVGEVITAYFTARRSKKEAPRWP